MNSRELLKQAASELRQAGVPDPVYDSAALLSFVTGHPPLALRLDDSFEPSETQRDTFRNLMDRRKSREPLQYLLGTVSFRGLELLTEPGVLIPRPETELLAEWAEERLRGLMAPEILDLCCGSGCLGLSLKKALPDARVTLSDVSRDAIRLTRKNSERLGTDCEILQGDLFHPVAGRRFDCILSNPPYIPSAECGLLQEEVLREPRLALDGGEDGMDFYRRIAAEAPVHMKTTGLLMLEVGIREAEKTADLMRECGAVRTEIREDMAGIPRMILAEYR